MVTLLHTDDPTFESQFQSWLSVKPEMAEDVTATVSAIIADIKTRGDDALLSYTTRFDRLEASSVAALRVPLAAIATAFHAASPETREALTLAKERIEAYHRKQLPSDFSYNDDIGVTLGNRWRPIDAVGLYVPGGKASYPSSVLMNAIPARVAGVSRMVMVVPAPEGHLNPVVLAAAYVAGIEEIYTIGGAQAIAALALGTATISPVHKIVGPGNAYVAAAKRQLFGVVGIDMIAGPSEILVISDNKTPPEWVAADLLSQAEHDALARSILLTDDADYARAVIKAVELALVALPRQAIARASWEKQGLVVVAPERTTLVRLANRIAAEHVELMVDDAEALAEQITHAGALFLGRYTPEAIGDYMAGPSHVLPTSGTAAFSSGLSVFDFIKRTSIIGCSREAFLSLSMLTAHLADTEGLDAHALSIHVRQKSIV